MSKKKTKRKGSGQVSKAIESKSTPKKIDWHKASQILFIVFFLLYSFFFLRRFSESPDNTNQLFLKKAGSLVTIEYIVFTLLSASFLYFVLRSLGGFLSTVSKKADLVVFIITCVSLITLYSIGFTEEVLPNGDNAEYLINTKSIVERGAPYRLESPREGPNSLASIGLPIILSPIYLLWGFDFVKMKILITILGLSIFPLLILIFRKYHDLHLSIALALVSCVSAHMVSSATVIMTEIPYVFWSCIAILAAYRYNSTVGFELKWLLALFGAALMTYLTRAVGITMFAAIAVFLFLQVPWKDLFIPERRRKFVSTPSVKKLLYFAGPILFFAIMYQVLQAQRGISQTAIFIRDILTFFPMNLDSATRVLGPMLFSEDTYRWYIFTNNFSLSPFNFIWLSVLLVTSMGMIIAIFKRQLIGIYTLFAFTIIILASQTPAEMVIIRYLTVISPFLIYFLFIGVYHIVSFVINLSTNRKNISLPKLAGVSLLVLMLFNNLGSSAATIALNTVGNGPAYYDYIEISEWCNRNLPEDAYVLTMKPRLFWIYANRKAGKLSSIDENYTESFENAKLESWKRQGVTHIVIDGMSAAPRENISPIVQNNPDLFRTIYVATTGGTAAVLKINDY